MCSALRWICIPTLNLVWTVALVLGFSFQPATRPLDNSALSSSAPERAHVAFTHPLPQIDGSKLHVTLVEVNYGPGESSTPHTHPCPVIGYVLDGALRTQVAGEALVVYHPGDAFYEAPNGLHVVSANASATAPAKFLAFFVCDNEADLSSPAPASKSEGTN